MQRNRVIDEDVNGVTNQADVIAIEAQGFPADLPASTYEMICRGAAIDPSAPALSFFLNSDEHRAPERWTYGELMRDITRTANMLRRFGVTDDTVVAYVLPNLPETHLVIWGGEAAGIVFAVSPLLGAKAIANLLNAVQAKVLVTVGPSPGIDLWPIVQTALGMTRSLEHVVLVDIERYVRGAKRNLAPVPEGSAVVPARITVHDFHEAMAREDGDALNSARRFLPDDRSSYFCTGGTTGSPKIAMRSHRNEVTNAWSARRFLGDSVGPGKTMFCGLPLFHVNAVLVTGLLPFSQGAHVLLGTPQGYRGEGVINRFWEIVEHHRVNFFSGVPTVYASLLDVPINGRDVRSLEYGLCGAAPMPVEVFRTFQERTGVRILEGYGLTECCCISSINPPRGERRIGSIGLRLPGQAMKAVVVDDADRYVRDCATDEPGVLVISGPNVFAGYANPEQNKGVWLDVRDGKRWLNTGDLARCDSEGYFWLTGRKKDLIIRGGHNIDPSIIEEPLHRHPAVQLAAAVGRPDLHAGELPVAYVQLKHGATATEQELLEYLRGQIGERAALPKEVRIVDAMPLTGVGKIFKPELKQRETIDAVRSVLEQNGFHDAEVALDVDQSRGTSIRIRLSDAGLKEGARDVLRGFPFSFSI